MLVSGNMAWKMYSGLTEAPSDPGRARLRGAEQLYLPKMVSGSGQEPCASPRRTLAPTSASCAPKAEPLGDGSYAVTGTKIFISAGEHDLTENIVHLVLARLPDAPRHEGHQPVRRAEVPARRRRQDRPANGVKCGSIEHKMGIHASPTCVMHFNDSKGWLVGKANEGLACMFTMMNTRGSASGCRGRVSRNSPGRPRSPMRTTGCRGAR